MFDFLFYRFDSFDGGGINSLVICRYLMCYQSYNRYLRSKPSIRNDRESRNECVKLNRTVNNDHSENARKRKKKMQRQRKQTNKHPCMNGIRHCIHTRSNVHRANGRLHRVLKQKKNVKLSWYLHSLTCDTDSAVNLLFQLGSRYVRLQ